ncbi:MAG: hypothetical protein BGO31_16850 [Bacteroidetes bacterium 43-16]|nr:MAG: hypothetical protein BGO31_16850 [Bacteroidetes bacterium 43-16]
MLYLGRKASSTQNISFINNTFVFLNDRDTLLMNVKVPFDTAKNEIFNMGIFYNCHLKEDSIYSITMKKICPSDIPKGYHNYYAINIISDKKDCSKFKEIVKNTKYKYLGNYEKYVDINGVIFEIIDLNPKGDCFLPH